MPLWLAQQPLVLASKSAIRQEMLLRAGIPVEVRHCDIARLTMRAFSDEFLDGYLDEAGPIVTASVGGYQLEKAGVQLFERIEGDHFVVLGLPLLPLLRFLRDDGWLAA